MTVLGGMKQADNMRSAAAANAENARRSAEANKIQTDYAAGQAQAAGQHQAEKDRYKAMIMASRARALGADDTLIAGILGRGETQAGYTMYEANERATGLRYRGDVGTYEANARGINEINQANKQADATVLGSFAKAGMSMAGRFAPSAAPGVQTIGDTTYYGGAGPDRNWGYGD
jgi:hypothetical protein